MVEVGLADQMVTIINDVNCQERTLPLSNLKRRWEETDDDGNVQHDDQPKKLKQEHVATQTTTDFEPIFFDPNEQSYEDLPPGCTFFTKSFYASD
jgi:hypothetical protein